MTTQANINEDIPRRVLIVDDDQDFLESLQEILEPKGYTVETASDIHSAIEVASRFDAHVALLDIRLGREDGMQLIAQLKEEHADLLCVMMTAYRSVESAVGAIKQGAYDYLTKPLYPDELLATLERCFEKLRLMWEHREGEAALAHAKTRFEAMFNSIPDAVMFADTERRIIMNNPAVYEMFGYSNDELIGHTTEMLYANPANFRDQGRKRYRKGSVKKKDPYEVKYKRKDGSTFWTETVGTQVEDKEGKVIGFIGIFRDITERKRSEETLRRVNRTLRALSACNEALVRATEETELLNRVCNIIVEVTGYRLAWVGLAQQDKAKTVRPVAQAGFNDGYLDTINATWADTEQGRGPTGTAIRTGKPMVVRNILTDPSFEPWRDAARRRGYSSSIALPLITSGQTFGALNIYAEAPDAFNTEEVRLLQELADDLAFGTNALRSQEERQLLQRQLQQSQKMEAIGQLTGGIAHDFNNILASIMGYTGLALDRCAGDDKGKLAEYLMEVYHAGERARDLVAQMLAFSRGDTGEPIILALQPLVKEVVKMLSSTLPSSIELHSRLEGGIPAVMIDPVQMYQVVMNLCINARDAMQGSGHIDVWLCRVPDIRTVCASCHGQVQGDFVELAVRDTGGGVEPEIMERMFDPFFTTKEVGKGTGMGLSMVHGIVHKHGGHLLVETVAGAGATFRLLFPSLKQASAVTGSAEEVVAMRRLPGHEINGHILVVDDEESVARFMGELLESRGYRITVETDSRQALARFRERPEDFDMVVTDQTMPGVTGVELAQGLLLLRPDLPVILCTGHSELVDEGRAKELGISAYLNKPLETRALLDIVKELLQARQNA